MIEFDAAWAFGTLGHRGRNHLHRCIQQLEDAFAGGHGRLQDVVFLAEVHDRAEEAQSVLDEGDQHAQRRCTAGTRRNAISVFQLKLTATLVTGDASHHVAAAEPDHAGNRNDGKNFDRRVVDRVGHDRVFVRVHVAAIDFREAVVGLALAIEELQHDHPADVLLQIGVDAGDGDADAAVGFAHPVAENLGGYNDKRQHSKSDQRQLPVHAQHHAENAEEHEEVFEDGDHAGGEHFIQCVDVGGDARDQAADGILVEEGNVQALQMAEDLAAEIEHHFLAGPLHEVGLQKLEQEAEDQQSDIDGRDLRDAGDGVRAEPTPDTGESRWQTFGGAR